MQKQKRINNDILDIKKKYSDSRGYQDKVEDFV